MKPRSNPMRPVQRPEFSRNLRRVTRTALSASAVACYLPLASMASLTSANYSIEPTAFAGGAAQSASASYSTFSGIATFVVGTGTSDSYTAHYGFFPSATPQEVTGRHIFYNQSAWDGNSAAANPNDDNAIAPDKSALRPGGIATFANYTSFSRGINGVMIDLPNGAAPIATDFTFRRGNNNSPAGWSVAPDPSTIAVRPGAGVGGADRVTLIWPNSSIQKQWLQVSVLATARTGLSTPDTFYFGNAVGDTGNSAANAVVNGTDESGIRANPRSVITPAPRDFPFDINRDRLVNGTDVSIVRANPTGVANALRLINLGGGDPASSTPALAALRTPDALDDVASPSQPGRLDLHTEGSDTDRVLHGWFASEPGSSAQNYRIQTTESLVDEWHDVTPPPAALLEGDIVLFSLPAPPQGQSRFYRVVRTDESPAP